MTALLDAVDALTQPDIQHLAQKDDLGHWLKAVTVTHPPLLVRMREATFPSSNTTAGSASSASTRSPADLEAMYQYGLMTTQIGDWCRIAGIPTTRDAVKDLRAWYVTTLTNEVDDWYTSKLRSWAALIRNHLDPPETFVIEHPCPVCHTTGWGNAIDGGDRYPIEVRYRKTETGMTDEIAVCRAPACRTVWVGHDAIHELADELNETPQPSGPEKE